MLPNQSFNFQRIALHIATSVLLCTTLAWARGNERVLYRFSGGKDGYFPTSSLVLDDEGDIYGTTVGGGEFGGGNIFLLAHKTGRLEERVLYSFMWGKDGFWPYGGVILDKAGNLYGTTYGNTVFMLSHLPGGKWKETVLHYFTGGGDGDGPDASLTMDSAGNLYGTTYGGGSRNGGTVFELKPSNGGWEETVLHSFTYGEDGGHPYAGVTLDRKGNLYGTTTEYGDTSCNPAFGCGTVFKLTHTQSGWEHSVLHRFHGGADGSIPFSNITLDAAGNLYGTTEFGGAYGSGTAFRLTRTKTGWKERVLHSFGADFSDGIAPYAGSLVFDAQGNLYGTTSAGGVGGGVGYGVVFKLSPAGGGAWTEKTVHRFDGRDGGVPMPGWC